MYKFKLHPDVEFLWQRAKTKLVNLNSHWYDTAPIGRDTLNTATKTLSKNAGLSQSYTNHCIQATVITELNESGFEARDIMAMTGHRSESGIRSYATKVPTRRRRKVSDALVSKMMKTSEKSKKKEVTSTVIFAHNADTIPDPTVPHDFDPSSMALELFPDFTEDDDIPNDELLKVLTQIESENQGLINNAAPQNVQVTPEAKTPKTINYSSLVANIHNRSCQQCISLTLM